MGAVILDLGDRVAPVLQPIDATITAGVKAAIVREATLKVFEIKNSEDELKSYLTIEDAKGYLALAALICIVATIVPIKVALRRLEAVER